MRPLLITSLLLLAAASPKLHAAEASAAQPPCAKPVWPVAALRLEQQGKVTMRYMTDHDGTVLQAEVVSSSGHPLLDEAARQGLMKCKMPNAQKADPALHAWNKIQYVWTLANRSPEEMAARLALVNAGVARGEAASMHELGSILMAGRGVPRDTKAGLEWLRKAVDKGNLPSYDVLAGFYHFGTHVTRDVPEAERLLRIAAEQGQASSQALLGMLLMRGAGIEARPEEGLEWLRKAAAADDLRGQAYLGMELMRRAGEQGDRSEALAWLGKASERGEANAQYFLGKATLHGHGLAKDPERALELLTRSAAAAHLPAQNTLASLYASGAEGVSADPVKASQWRTAASKNALKGGPGMAPATGVQ